MPSSKNTDPRVSRGSDSVPDEAADARAGVSPDAACGASPPASWDPYDVWLKRVKQPRDETRRQRRLDQRDVDRASQQEGAEGVTTEPAPKPSPI